MKLVPMIKICNSVSVSQNITNLFGSIIAAKLLIDRQNRGIAEPELEVPRLGTEVKVLKYITSMEVVMQGTNLLAAIDHLMHLHGHSFYVVCYGFGNFDEKKDPLAYNLEDPPLRNTAAIPRNGWIAIRFRANNPGVWFMHCHLEHHLTWGMDTVFIIENGERPDERILPPPPDMPQC
ncbi:hypothetical protein RJ640_022516 [Escallonia rubra]|uniref:Plastocyanin-like domain-containing protein n=1 Tax=Escallonia rubra TaxID=112253 RepID=A0AA88R8Q1_9ASTE|nr:hypothetical protein RJ640_022516 [Escallonia rubra]